MSNTETVRFFSYATLVPVHKPRVAHYKDPNSALIAGLIEDALNNRRKSTASKLVFTTLAHS